MGGRSTCASRHQIRYTCRAGSGHAHLRTSPEGGEITSIRRRDHQRLFIGHCRRALVRASIGVIPFRGSARTGSAYRRQQDAAGRTKSSRVPRVAAADRCAPPAGASHTRPECHLVKHDPSFASMQAPGVSPRSAKHGTVKETGVADNVAPAPDSARAAAGGDRDHASCGSVRGRGDGGPSSRICRPPPYASRLTENRCRLFT